MKQYIKQTNILSCMFTQNELNVSINNETQPNQTSKIIRNSKKLSLYN